MDKHLKIFQLAVIHNLRNYKSLVGLSLFLVTCLVIFTHIWKFAAAKMGANNLDPDKLLWYIAFNQWILIALPGIHEDIEQDLRSGKLSYLLPRPISYLGSIFCEGLGILCVHFLILGTVAFSFTAFMTESLPFSLGSFFLTIALSLLAGIVGLLFQMLIGISAFWLGRIDPFHWMWEKLLFTLGGLMLPLTVYPLWLQKIAYATPFPSILGQRSALTVEFTANAVLSIASSLVLWGSIALCSMLYLYKRGLKIINMEGG